MKNILIITTVILALLFCTTTMAEKVQPLTSGDYQYIVLEDNTAEITKYIGKAKALTVKDTLDGLTVTSIGDEAFSWCSSLTSISLPDSLTNIGDRAFSWCSSLTSISLPDSLTSIGDRAFYNCPNLTLTVPRDSYAKQYCIDNNLP